MQFTYKKTELTPRLLPIYSKLLNEAFGYSDKFTAEYLNWLYYQNPAGMVLGFDAFYQEKLVGHYVTIPVIYFHNKEKLTGLLSLNTAVAEQCRGMGLFTKLANLTIDEAKENKFDFIIGVANQNSTYGFINKLGFKLLSPLKAVVGKGSITPVLSQKDLLIPDRSQNFINWRLKMPFSNYKIDSRGNISKYLYNSFFKVRMGETKFNTHLNKSRKGIFDIQLYNYPKENKSGFFMKIPDKFKPSPLNLIFKSLNSAHENVSKENIIFSCLDFDAY